MLNSFSGSFVRQAYSTRTCGQILDKFGDHLLSCGQGSARTRRHLALCDVVFHTLLVDNSDTRREQRCSFRDGSRQGDVYHRWDDLSTFQFGIPFSLLSLMRQLVIQKQKYEQRTVYTKSQFVTVEACSFH